MIFPEVRSPVTGDEEFVGLGGSVRDFWAFAVPDLRVNNVRGWLAEYLVWRALGVDHPVRREWDAFDIEWEGIRIEVKSSGYLQTWQQSRLSRLVFAGLSARYWRADETSMAVERTFNADVYVFCVQTSTTHEEYDPLDVTQWRFAVLSRLAVERLNSVSLSWARVVSAAGEVLEIGGIAGAVRAAVDRPDAIRVEPSSDSDPIANDRGDAPADDIFGRAEPKA